MNEVTYEAATWGSGWKEAEQGSTVAIALFDNTNGAQINVPYGMLLGKRDCIVQQSETADFLFGISRKCDYIVLSDCSVRSAEYPSRGAGKQMIRGNWLMRSKSMFDPEAPISEIRFELTGLLEWSGRNMVEEITQYDKDYAFLRSSAVLSAENQESEKLYSGDSYSIELRFCSIRGPKKLSETVFRNKAIAAICFSSAVTLDEALFKLHKVQSFASFCCGWYAGVESVTLINKQGISIDYHCRYICNDKVPGQDDYMHMPIPLISVGDKVDSVLGKWLDASEELTAACNVLVPLSTRKSDTYMDLQFLAASQTLESLSVEGRSVKAFSDEEFDRMKEIVRNSIQDNRVRQWACNRLFGHNSNKLGQRKLLGDLYDFIGSFAAQVFPDKKAFIQRHVQMRNDITHRNPASMSIDHSRLFYHTQGVIILCHAAIMRKIGLTESEVVEHFSRSHFREYLIREAADL